ncbi:MAG: hypothetical protein ACR5LA_13295 [Wolbachia sp.]
MSLQQMVSSQCLTLGSSFLSNSQKVFHSITQNPYSPNQMHYLQLSFLDASVKHWDDTIYFYGCLFLSILFCHSAERIQFL